MDLADLNFCKYLSVLVVSCLLTVLAFMVSCLLTVLCF